MVSRKKQILGHAATKPTVDEFLAVREQMNRTSVEFLKTDLETALTFAKIARQSRDSIRKNRNSLAARKGYETLLRLVPKVELGDDDGRILADGLNRLRAELEALGETF